MAIMADLMWLMLLSLGVGPAAAWDKNDTRVDGDPRPFAEACINWSDGNPPAMKWDRPAWKWTDNDKCRANPALRQASCYHALEPMEDGYCRSFCVTNRGWFHGAPVNLMPGGMCHPGDACSRQVQVSQGDARAIAVTWGNSSGDTFTENGGQSVTVVTGFTFTETLKNGLFGLAEHSSQFAFNTGLQVQKQDTWAKAHAVGVSAGGSDTRTHTITIAVSTTNTRSGAEQMSYCGSWYAVPKVFFECGIGAWAALQEPQFEGGKGKCLMKASHQKPLCHYWALNKPLSDIPEQEPRPAMTRNKGNSADADDFGTASHGPTTMHDKVFVRKDCQTGMVLPPAFQDDPFRNSMNLVDFYNTHMPRFRDYLRPAETDAEVAQIYKEEKQLFTLPEPHLAPDLPMASERSIGPKNYTIKLCATQQVDAPTNWCERHKLPDSQCFTFGRGSNSGYALFNSAEASEGNCCVLFSRHQCLGRVQRIIGKVDDFTATGFADKAQSVMCNVDEYCNPQRRETGETGTVDDVLQGEGSEVKSDGVTRSHLG